MKIGILTFHSAHNYGAVIQCYGLQEYLTSLGHQVYVIDYRPHYFDNYKLPEFTITSLRGLKKYIREKVKDIIIGRRRRRRFYSFDDFINKHLNLISYDSRSDYSNFDAIILGSDQIWNPHITGGQFDDVYFGKNAKCKVISYAASSRFASLTEEQKKFFASNLRKIDYISVRETSLMNLLQPLVNVTITTVIDPSLLPDVQTYAKLCTPINTEKKYVLIYEVKRNEETSRIANEIAQSLNIEVIELASCASPRYIDKNIIQDAGPIEFLSYIKNATCIVTSSFHGMALSLKFQKDFYSVRQGTDADLRAESLLARLGLLERYVHLNSSVTFTKINYIDVIPKLNMEISVSKDFLINALKYELKSRV